MSEKTSKLPLIFLNLTEHGFTRVLDAFVTLVVIWLLPIEKYARIGLAQSASAILFVLFLSPEANLYRHYGEWKARGLKSLRQRIHIYRTICWAKLLLAVSLSMMVPLVYWALRIHPHFDYEWVWACLLTFTLSFGPQVLFADREFLRLELRFKAVNAVTLLQKFSLLSGIGLVYLLKLPLLPGLAISAIFSMLISGVVARALTERAFSKLGETVHQGEIDSSLNLKTEFLSGAKEIAIISQITGSIQNTALSMDIFMMGVYTFSPTTIGLYSAMWKVANLGQAIPVAIAGVFSVLTGRKDKKKVNIEEDWIEIRSWAFQLFGIGVLQAFLVWTFRDQIFHLLSRGRWGEFDIALMNQWVTGLLVGSAFLAPLFVLLNWIGVRARLLQSLIRIYVPWGVFSALTYGWLAKNQDPKILAYLSPICAIFALSRALSFIRREIKHQIQEAEKNEVLGGT